MLADPLVWTGRVEVGHPFGQDPPKVILAEDQDVVEALAAEAAEETLADRIQVGDFGGIVTTSMPAPSAASAKWRPNLPSLSPSCAKTPAACGSPGNWPIDADGGRLRLRNLSPA